MFFPAATTISPAEIITLVMNGNCTWYLQISEKQKFSESLAINLAYQLGVDKARIRILSISCGSIIVNLTVDARGAASSAPTKAVALGTLRGLLSNGLMRITLYDGIVAAVAPGVNISTLPPIPPITTKKPVVPEFETNWVPLFISFIFAVVTIMLISACVAWLHGRYYKKKHYTDINCNRTKTKAAAIDEEQPENLNKKDKNKRLEDIMEGRLCTTSLLY